MIGRIVWADFTDWPAGKIYRSLRAADISARAVGFRPLERQPLQGRQQGIRLK
jgi:hypothetical protein